MLSNLACYRVLCSAQCINLRALLSAPRRLRNRARPHEWSGLQVPVVLCALPVQPCCRFTVHCVR